MSLATWEKFHRKIKSERQYFLLFTVLSVCLRDSPLLPRSTQGAVDLRNRGQDGFFPPEDQKNVSDQLRMSGGRRFGLWSIEFSLKTGGILSYFLPFLFTKPSCLCTCGPNRLELHRKWRIQNVSLHCVGLHFSFFFFFFQIRFIQLSVLHI